jgi:hypothetical protein
MRKNAFAALAGLLLVGTAAADGYWFQRPQVLDLSDSERVPVGAMATAVVDLPAEQAQTILAKPGLSLDDADQLPYLGQRKSARGKAERELIADEHGALRRAGGLLTVKPGAGPSLEFHNRRHGDDGETFVFAGRPSIQGYYRVEVQFLQDSPGSFLINPATGKTAFVHNGGDITVVAADGTRVLDFNPDNGPFLLAVAALDADGPRLEVQCRAAGDAVDSAVFKGWNGAAGADLVLKVKGPAGSIPTDLPLRVAPGAQGWVLATRDRALLTKSGYACSS